MQMSDMNKAKLRALKDDILDGKDFTKSDVVFLLKVITFLEIDNKNLSETLDRRDKRKSNYISKDKIKEKIDEITKEYYKLFEEKRSLDFMNINGHRYNAMKLVLEELLND